MIPQCFPGADFSLFQEQRDLSCPVEHPNLSLPSQSCSCLSWTSSAPRLDFPSLQATSPTSDELFGINEEWEGAGAGWLCFPAPRIPSLPGPKVALLERSRLRCQQHLQPGCSTRIWDRPQCGNIAVGKKKTPTSTAREVFLNIYPSLMPQDFGFSIFHLFVTLQFFSAEL